MTRDPESVYRSTPETELPLFRCAVEAPLQGHEAAGSRGNGKGVAAQPEPRSVQAHARRSDPQTSHEAAKSVRDITETHDAIVGLFRAYGPMTDEQLALRYEVHREAVDSYLYPKVSPSGLRSRRSELVLLNRVEACGEGRTASGRKCTIWRLKEKG